MENLLLPTSKQEVACYLQFPNIFFIDSDASKRKPMTTHTQKKKLEDFFKEDFVDWITLEF